MTVILPVPPIFYNVITYGAAANGVQDDTTFIQNAINAASAALATLTGGILSGIGYVYLPGICAISAPLTLPKNIWLIGSGYATGLRALAGFVGSEMILISAADQCGVKDMQIIGGPNNASASNPTIGAAIEISGSRQVNLINLQIYYVKGWAIEGIATAGVNFGGGCIHNIHINHCASGLHIQGVSGSNFVGQLEISDVLCEVVDGGAGTGDAFYLQDVNDCQLTNCGGAAAGGAVSGSAIHIKGGSSNTFTNVDVGMIAQATVSPTILIETGTADPTNIIFAEGIAQAGQNVIQITAANNIKFASMTLKNSNVDGVNISGALAGPITFKDCLFKTNNQSGGTAYEINSSQTTGNFYVEGCIFQTQVGSGAGQVTNCINDVQHRGYIFFNHFAGTGTTPSLVFAGTPQIIRGCIGYNPRGSITPATIGASPFTGNSSQNDIQIVFTAINGMTAFSIGGTSIGVVPVAGVPYRVPARQSFTITYTTTAPTYLWFAD